MKRVIIESPYAGQVPRNLRYLKDCIQDCISRGEAPFASHGFYPVALNDDDAHERQLGIEAGLIWGKAAEATVVYVDLGVSPGMEKGIEVAQREDRPVERRSLPKWAAPEGLLGEVCKQANRAFGREMEVLVHNPGSAYFVSVTDPHEADAELHGPAKDSEAEALRAVLRILTGFCTPHHVDWKDDNLTVDGQVILGRGFLQEAPVSGPLACRRLKDVLATPDLAAEQV